MLSRTSPSRGCAGPGRPPKQPHQRTPRKACDNPCLLWFLTPLIPIQHPLCVLSQAHLLCGPRTAQQGSPMGHLDWKRFLGRGMLNPTNEPGITLSGRGSKRQRHSESEFAFLKSSPCLGAPLWELLLYRIRESQRSFQLNS